MKHCPDTAPRDMLEVLQVGRVVGGSDNSCGCVLCPAGMW
jgi:hypothetical protein